uniref:Uncharacterized protein n=1 Tax=Glossina palpalis gambiensis TaxID=67801 RepID=A0A1B0AUB0_9MUSC
MCVLKIMYGTGVENLRRRYWYSEERKGERKDYRGIPYMYINTVVVAIIPLHYSSAVRQSLSNYGPPN